MGSVPPTAVERLGRAPRARLVWLRASVAVLSFAAAVARRLIDLAVGLTASILTAPVVIVAFVIAAMRRAPALHYRSYIGRWQAPLELASLSFAGPFRRVPWLWAVVRGDLSLVGPAPLADEERETVRAADLPRFQVRPGLANLFRIRQAANIAFEGRTAADLEQVHVTSLKREAGILLRSIPAAVIGARVVAPPPELDLLDVRIDNWTMEQAIRWIVSAKRTDRIRQLAFVNPDCLNTAFVRPSYRRVLDEADVVLPDGIGIHYACRLTGTALAANVNGTDLFPRLCDALSGTGLGAFFLGAKPEVVEALVANVRGRWPELTVAGYRHGYFARGADEEQRVIENINTSGAHVLLVAFGAPGQEEWIAAHREQLAVQIAFGVGGLFDFYSGRIPRAPIWMRELGLEWTWRLLQEPGRMWRRYIIGNPLFLWRVWRWSRARKF